MMFLQSHNQVLYHLSQLAAAFTPRSITYSTRTQKSDVHSSINHDNIYQENFAEAVKNCTELYLDNLDIHRLFVPPKLKKERNCGIRHLNAIDRALKQMNDQNGWKVSYVSGASFNENKCGFSCSPLSTPIIFAALGVSLDKIHNANPHSYIPTSSKDIIARGFKTYRNIEAENDRNPTLIGRFRTWIGLYKYAEDKQKSSDRTSSDGLKNILNTEKFTTDQKQHLKVAFAEGYMAGNDQKVPPRSFKLLKFMQQISYTLIAVIILLSVAAMYQSSINGNMFKIQYGKSSIVDPEEINVTFDDVKGVEEAKQELTEVVEFLKNPEKFSALGGRLPKGVLLVGPPGTGKTLLARAVAGEANVPFFHAAGPEFDEILVGQGAKRIRELFKAAKERAPCVVFIDEIDSVGGKRTTSILHPYANQTINQLLSEMDGFHQNTGVIVLGATNRREHLDKALRRPGRFDTEVLVYMPDYKGRKDIIELYMTKILSKSVNVDILAKTTIGFTGADLENMVNQAAIRAAIEGAEFVTMQHLERARDKLRLGPELKGRMPDYEESKVTAYHEAGHAIVAYYTKDSQLALSKITIVPRNRSLGHTSFMPCKDISHETKAKLLAKMDMAFGGRAAEELIFGPDKVTTGTYNDLRTATNIAEALVTRYGMSEKVGLRIGKMVEEDRTAKYSPATKEIIDDEVKRLLQESFERAKTILKDRAAEHKLLAEALLKYETLDAEDVKKMLSAKIINQTTGDNRPSSVSDNRPSPISDNRQSPISDNRPTPISDVPTNVM